MVAGFKPIEETIGQLFIRKTTQLTELARLIRELMTGVSYKDSGVDLEVYNEAMKRLPRLMHRTFSPRVRQLDGGFAGLFQLDFESKLFRRNYQDPMLVACTDGVGTKLKLAQMLNSHRTVGIDLVAMCVNDAICCGAEPLFFLSMCTRPCRGCCLPPGKSHRSAD